MKDVLLIFLTSVIILLIGIFFGFGQIKKTYEVASSASDLSVPFAQDFDKDFIREKSF